MVTEKSDKKGHQKSYRKKVKLNKKKPIKRTEKKKSRIGYHPWMDDNEEFHENVASLHKHFKSSSKKAKKRTPKKLQKNLSKKLQNWTIRAEYKKIKGKEYGPYFSAYKKIKGKLHKIYLGKEVG